MHFLCAASLRLDYQARQAVGLQLATPRMIQTPTLGKTSGPDSRAFLPQPAIALPGDPGRTLTLLSKTAVVDQHAACVLLNCPLASWANWLPNPSQSTAPSLG
ncbi:hypothetical protein [uncultured Thiodictyon sp.]|uniref:hypothetical protein n=1 Tax=uncultured Thiodictyon sp. TaxID=1846217 RepID=UPI0025F17DA4|nr:hypothetical protein [uncultured Thiodictyon sp.]